jgi:hypothetical protein
VTHSAPSVPGGSSDVRPEDNEVDPRRLDATVRAFREQLGVTAWYGTHTGHWWAMAWPRLLEAEEPGQLARQVRRVVYGVDR